jgi:putative copper resistance protein D
MDNFLFLPRFLAAATADIAYTGAFGFVLVGLWLRYEREADLHRQLRRGVLGCTFALLLALTAQSFVLTATMAGSTDLASIRDQFFSVMTATHAGCVLLCECVLTLLFVGLLFTLYGRQTRAGAWRLLTLLILLAATRAATGHASADGNFSLPEFVQFVHIVSTAVWAGCILAAGFVVLPAMLQAKRSDATARFARTLSRAVTIALLLILLSGLYNSWRGLGGSLTPLAGTEWGRSLDLKLVLVGIALTLGASSRRMLGSSRDPSHHELSRLTRLVRIEAVVMFLVLAVSAWLANSPPANPG